MSCLGHYIMSRTIATGTNTDATCRTKSDPTIQVNIGHSACSACVMIDRAGI